MPEKRKPRLEGDSAGIFPLGFVEISIASIKHLRGRPGKWIALPNHPPLDHSHYGAVNKRPLRRAAQVKGRAAVYGYSVGHHLVGLCQTDQSGRAGRENAEANAPSLPCLIGPSR